MANNITNVLSAQAMQRSPDINAANALQRVSAVTIQRNSGSDEAFAIIRGLEPRYNNTLINGVKVTSPPYPSIFLIVRHVLTGSSNTLPFHSAVSTRIQVPFGNKH